LPKRYYIFLGKLDAAEVSQLSSKQVGGPPGGAIQMKKM